MNDTDFLRWVRDRLVHVYKESPNTDFVLRMEEVTKRFENLLTLEQGYRVIEDASREAHDRYKDKSE